MTPFDLKRSIPINEFKNCFLKAVRNKSIGIGTNLLERAMADGSQPYKLDFSREFNTGIKDCYRLPEEMFNGKLNLLEFEPSVSGLIHLFASNHLQQKNCLHP